MQFHVRHSAIIPSQSTSRLALKVFIILTLGFLFFLSPVNELGVGVVEATKIDASIYSGTGSGEEDVINNALLKVIRYIGGIGGSLFTLAILIIAILIFFGSISATKMRAVWIGLISCIAGALLFYSAYFLAPAIQNLAKVNLALPFL